MRSFIKSHSRGSSSALDTDLGVPRLSGSAPGTPLEGSHNFPSHHNSPVLPHQTSPGRINGTSPSRGRSGKLHRLFGRSKGSSANIQGLLPVSPSKGSSPPPSIIGTRTHEWGSASNNNKEINFSKIPTKTNTSEKSSSAAASLYSSSESNRNSAGSISNNRLSKHASSEDSDFIQLPLNTVLEIPDNLSPTRVGTTRESQKKYMHRRAQIVTADSPTTSDALSPGLGVPARIFPTIDSSLISPQDASSTGSESPEIPQGLGAPIDLHASPSIPQNETNRTLDPALAVTPIATPKIPETKRFPDSDKDEHRDHDEDTNSSHESEFSFEQDRITGRNTSIRYYKNPQEVQAEQINLVREKGFYIDDYMEDDFDDDMNYFDEDDDGYNDDEELFNKKYFSDDEEDPVPMMQKLSITREEPVPPQTGPEMQGASTPITTPEKEVKHPTASDINDSMSGDDPSKLFEELNSLRPKRSLKYHQLPTNFEQEFSERRYSWLSDEENTSNRGSRSYDSLLDEINGIPDDYDYDNASETKPSLSRSKQLKSSIKRFGVMEDTPQNTKFTTSDKTVTLFHRSRTGSLRSTTSPEPTEVTIPTAPKEQFAYLTPNNSFTMPHPMFKDQRDLELSPISEGSYIDDSMAYDTTP
ncbi:CYFA0S14e01002g1_1 [Cyberlindnera fabianii]|uniref:CYFA0S14e01002g1_1 n=1 Tax=Cyberlindnera fabianii TaxID=36022 RepID=A0A061B330_CYBFA|nr:CYFA0S14e01002g1_1 [Cyberlindnera fabianii]